MSQEINYEEFNETPIIKKLKKSQSKENLQEIEKPKKRGRKQKYSSEEERLEARRKQQREYRIRKKNELLDLKNKIKEYENK